MIHARLLLLLVLCGLAPLANAAVHVPREQISLNGAWSKGGTVPDYSPQDTGFDHRTYERTVSVPSAWSGKRIQVEFNAVNFACDVYVNNNKIGSHVGAWVPFSYDLTGRVTPGQSFTLRLEVHGMLVAPTTVNGKVMWWIGYNDLDGKRAGIVDDVWLRAYGQTHIADTFVRTSVRNQEATVDWTVRNRGSVSWTGRVIGDITRSGSTIKTIQSAEFTLAAGQERVVSVTSAWSGAALWWPDQPVLHVLNSRLASGSTVADRHSVRFGFREFWIVGDEYRLNGIRINLRGDWCAFSQYWGAINDEATLRRHYQGVQATNSNILRWHKHPPPQFALHLADEMGLMIQSESAVYGRGYLNHSLKDQFITNCLTLIPKWVKATRNHASVVCWSASNEATYDGLGDFTGTQLKRLGDAIYALDDTRPVLYDGDTPVPSVIKSMHYPEGYEKNPTGDPYSAWASRLDSSRPTHLGEFLAVRPGVNDNAWWIGVWPRGLRAMEYAHICPRVYYNGSRITDAQEKLQALAYSPIALFDKAYDQLGIAPFKDGTLPTLTGGATVTRQFHLYNDDYRDRSVTVTIQLIVDGSVLASGTSTYDMALGSQRVVPCTFQVPKSGGKELRLVRRTSKGGTTRFEEAARFRLSGDTSGSTSNAITLGGGSTGGGSTNAKPTIELTSPDAGDSFAAPADIRLTASARDSDGTIAKVEFLADGVVIHTENGAPYDWTWTKVPAGTRTVTARAYDNDGAVTTSSAATVTIASAFNARINFQPASAPTPSGWLIDGGRTFGSRGNGMTYGWNVDVSAAARDRNDADSPDQQRDTLIHLQKEATPTARWEIAVPNGSYEVRLVAGDPAFHDSIFRLALENTLALSGSPSASSPWVDRTITVTVSDGRLTLSSASGADNNKISLIEIRQLLTNNG